MRSNRTFRLYIFGLLAASAVVSGCSPLAPSASKFGKTGNSSSLNQEDVASLTGPVQERTNGTVEANTSPNVTLPTNVRVISKEAFLNQTRQSTAMELNVSSVGEIMNAGTTAFNSVNSIKGIEGKLSKGSVVVLFVVDGLSREKLYSVQRATRAAVISCNNPLSNACSGSNWRLDLSEPAWSGDPANDTAPNHPRNLLLRNLVGIALEFTAGN